MNVKVLSIKTKGRQERIAVVRTLSEDGNIENLEVRKGWATGISGASFVSEHLGE